MGKEISIQVAYAQVLGKIVAYYRAKKKLNQKNLADAVGVTQTTISRLERGEVQASAFVVGQIAFVLGFEDRWLFWREVDEVLKESTQMAATVESDNTPGWLLIEAGDSVGVFGLAITALLRKKEEGVL